MIGDKHHQLMVWCGGLHEFWEFAEEHARQTGGSLTYRVYHTGAPSVWLWTTGTIDPRVLIALNIVMGEEREVVSPQARRARFTVVG